MKKSFKTSGIKILSPWYLSMLVGLFSLLFFFIPDNVYEIYVRENARLFGNFKAMAYILFCSLTFSLSSWLSYKNLSVKSYNQSNRSTRGSNGVYLFAIIILFINFGYVIFSFGLNNILSIYSLDSGYNGNLLKLELSEAISSGKLGWITDMSAALIVWLFWTTLKSSSIKKRLLFFICFVLYILNSAISISRDSIISLLIMLLSIYLLHLHKNSNLKVKYVAPIIFTFLIAFGGIFAIVGLARSSNINSITSEIARQFFGYFPASYNRLAYVLDGDLVYPQAGWGYYSTQFLWDFPLVSGNLGIYDFGRTVGIPLPESSYQNWQAQFTAVQESGLNPSYIWSTAFGFAFSDFGYFSIIYFILYGLIAGFLYRYFTIFDNFGVILYPYLISSIIKWPSVEAFTQRGIIIFFAAWLIVAILNNVVNRRTRFLHA